jgi:hypothetical protein
MDEIQPFLKCPPFAFRYPCRDDFTMREGARMGSEGDTDAVNVDHAWWTKNLRHVNEYEVLE